MAKKRATRGRRGGASAASRRQTAPTSAIKSQDEIFANLRTGAANVAGVAFQAAVSAHLLASARAGDPEMPQAIAIRPEGYEDVDVKLTNGNWLLVQCKLRGSGRRPMSVSDIAEVFAHAARVTAARDYDGGVEGVVLVTNGTFAAGLQATGWGRTLGETLDASALGELASAIAHHIGSDDDEVTERAASIARTARVVLVVQPAQASVGLALESAYGLSPVVASLASAELLADLMHVAASQRGAVVASAITRTLQNLDSLVASVSAAADSAVLHEAISSGVCELPDAYRAAPSTPEEFFAGVRVGPAHIHAGLDVIRVAETEQLMAAIDISRNVVIAAPSGAGKSTLLWRAAALFEHRELVVRVLRVANAADVSVLTRYVRQLRPSETRPVVVCVDDLGRDATAAWPEARDRLLEIAHVKLLGACRQEDFTPMIASGASVIGAELHRESARLIYERLSETGLTMAVAAEEAIDRAGGLLMEFIAIATTGQRIRDVLGGQLQSLLNRGEHLAVNALRLIMGLHTLGFAAPAEGLVDALSADEMAVGRAVRMLADEHLIFVAVGVEWTAIHDLRAEVLLELLHRTAPPTLAASYAKCVGLAPIDARPELYRRALARIARRETTSSASVEGDDAVQRMQRVLEPLRTAVGNDTVEAVALGRGELVARLIEIAERIDVVAYVVATRGYVDARTPDNLEVDLLYGMVYSARFDGIFAEDIPQFRPILRIADGLPAWSTESANAVIGRVAVQSMVDLMCGSPLETAVDLCEAVEQYDLTMHLKTVQLVFGTLSDPEPSDDLHRVGLVCQLVASLYRVGRLNPRDAAAAFGKVRDRASWAAGADPLCFRALVHERPLSELPESRSSNARTATFSDEVFLEIEVSAFARGTSDTAPEHAYNAQAGADPTTVNSQTVFLAQRLFDACPEVDIVEAKLVLAAAGVAMEDVVPGGYKRMRAGVLVRRADFRRNLAVQSVLAELSHGEQWTQRCREQAVVAAEVVRLVREVPARLNPWDNASRRRDWVTRVRQAGAHVARLPGIPPVDAAQSKRERALKMRATDVDAMTREGAKDPSRRALDKVTGALIQFADGLENSTGTMGAAMQLAEASEVLAEARLSHRLPTFAGIGELLPTELDALCSLAAKGISALARGTLPGRALSAPELARAVHGHSVEIAEAEVRDIEKRLTSSGVRVLQSSVAERSEPVIPSIYHQAVVAVPADCWDELGRLLSDPAEGDANLECDRVYLAAADGRALGLGFRSLAPRHRLLVMEPADVQPYADALGLTPIGRKWQTVASRFLSALVAEHAERVRMARRPAEWPTRGTGTTGDLATLPSGGPPAWQRARPLLEEFERRISDSEGDLSAFVNAIALSQGFPKADLDDPMIGIPLAALALAMTADLEEAGWVES